MKKLTRTESRLIVMNILYQIFLYKSNNVEYDVERIINDNLEVDEEFVRTIVNGVMSNYEEIVLLANEHLNGWTISRLGLTDQAILSMGIYELLYVDTPYSVSINEAIELAKEYSDDKVKNMINAVLDLVYHKSVVDGK